MVDRFRKVTGFPRLVFRTPASGIWLLSGAIFIYATVMVVSTSAQTPSAAAYPSSPTAAAGMTSGLPAGYNSNQAAMAQARIEAQSAQGQAVAASMARSADQALENQHEQRALQEAREIKFLKRDMAERMKWERSNRNQTQVNKVTSNDLSSWQTPGGNVRVERDVPDPFLQAMIEMEGQEKPPKKERKGFSGLNPFKKSEPDPMEGMEFVNEPLPGLTTPAPSPDPPVSTASSRSVSSSPYEDYEKKEGGGFFSNLKMPKIGNKNEEVVSAGQVYNSEPQFVGNSSGSSNVSSSQGAPSGRSATSASSSPSNTMVSARSGAALLDGSAGSPEPLSFSDEAPVEKKGFFSGFKKSEGSVASTSSSTLSTPSSSGGGGFLGFGKKKQSPNTIDAALFPDDAVSQAPTGRSLSGGYSAEDVAQDAAFAPSSTGEIVLPGESPRRKGLKMSMPEISMPNLSLGSGEKSSGGGSVPTLTTINSSGTDLYMVTSTAQFMVYGNDVTSSEVKALRSGTVVKMTKPGEQWASVRLPDGSEGVVQNKFLRAASAAESGGQFASQASN